VTRNEPSGHHLEVRVGRSELERAAVVAGVTMLLACAGTDSHEPGGTAGLAGIRNAGGAGGLAGAGGGASGQAGNAGLGGAGSGSSGHAGVGGAGSGSSGLGATGSGSSGHGGLGGAGRASSGSSGGRGGATANGGSAGRGVASAGAPSMDLPPVAGATFTDVYMKVFSQYCFGSGCHNPSGGNRPDFSTQAKAYAYFKNQGQLYPGQDPQKSYIYSIMHGNPSSSTPPYMPPTPNPKVAPDALAIVAGWIADGASND